MTIDASFVQEIEQLALTAALPTVVLGTEENPELASIYLRNAHGKDEIQIIDFEQYKPSPRRKMGNVLVLNVESFVAYVAKHMSDATLLLARDTQMVAHLNHHSADEPGWGDHCCLLQMKTTPAWDAWIGQAKLGYHEQEDFADFLESRVKDIVSPEAGAVLDLARDLKIHSRGEFHKDIRPGDGTVQFTYTDTHTPSTPRGNIDMKDGFPMQIGITAFEGAEAFVIKGKIRYKLTDGNLTFALVLEDTRAIMEAAIEGRIRFAEEALGMPVLRGSMG